MYSTNTNALRLKLEHDIATYWRTYNLAFGNSMGLKCNKI